MEIEALTALEKKVALLLDLVKELKTENVRLAGENSQLRERIEVAETSTLTAHQAVEEEKALTKIVVDDLIKSIDSFVHTESR